MHSFETRLREDFLREKTRVSCRVCYTLSRENTEAEGGNVSCMVFVLGEHHSGSAGYCSEVSRRGAVAKPNKALQATGDSIVFLGCSCISRLSPAPELGR